MAHGRVCMLAVLGFTVQTSGAKWEPFITRSSLETALGLAEHRPEKPQTSFTERKRGSFSRGTASF